MKKHLALVLALVMVLTSFSFVSAAPDFADVQDTVYENAVNRLELLEILKGYPDGTFKPLDSITRAEFATVAVRARGLAGVAATSAGLPSGFSDVPTWHWASGFIGTAASTGIVEGIGNGLFAPAAPVRYEEAVTMLVRALGYEPEARSKGGYPYGYLVVAEEIGLLDGASSTTGTYASRGMVALLTDNALEIPMMVSIGFGDNVRWVVSGSAEHGGKEVYLLNKLGVDEIEGIVMENFQVNSRLDAEEIKVKDLSDDSMVTLEVSGSVDVNAILGLEVTAWAKDDVVFAVTVDTDADLVAYDTVTAVTEDDVKLVVVDDTFDWAVRDENYGDAKVYVNNAKKNVEDAKGFGRIVMNEDDEIVFAYLFDAVDYGVITAIDDEEIEFVSVPGEDFDTIELDDAEEVYVFTKEFAAASLDDLEEEMSMYFWVDSDDNYYVVAFESMVEGELEEVRVRDTRVTVDGVNYSPNGDAIYSDDEMDNFKPWDSDLEGLVDEAVIVYLDYSGDAMLLVTDTSVTSTVFGLATWFSSGGRTESLTVFTAEGEEVTYNFDDRGILVDADFDGVKNATGPAIVGVKLVLDKDGEIEEYFTAEDVVTVEKESDKEVVKLGGASYYLTEDTVIVKALNSDEKMKPSIIEFEDIVDLGISLTSNYYVVYFEDEGKDLGLLVFADSGFTALDTEMFGIVTGDEYRRGSDYFAQIDVSGEEEAIYTLASSSYGLKKGDLVSFRLNNDGEAVVVKQALADITTSTPDEVERVLTNYFLTTGSAVQYRTTSDTLYYDTDDSVTTTNKAKFGGEISRNSIKAGDYIVVLENKDGNAAVVIDVTPFMEAMEATDERTPVTDYDAVLVDPFDMGTDTAITLEVGRETKVYGMNSTSRIVFATGVTEPADGVLPINTKVNFILVEGTSTIGRITVLEIPSN